MLTVVAVRAATGHPTELTSPEAVQRYASAVRKEFASSAVSRVRSNRGMRISLNQERLAALSSKLGLVPDEHLPVVIRESARAERESERHPTYFTLATLRLIRDRNVRSDECKEAIITALSDAPELIGAYPTDEWDSEWHSKLVDAAERVLKPRGPFQNSGFRGTEVAWFPILARTSSKRAREIIRFKLTRGSRSELAGAYRAARDLEGLQFDWTEICREAWNHASGYDRGGITAGTSGASVSVDQGRGSSTATSFGSAPGMSELRTPELLEYAEIAATNGITEALVYLARFFDNDANRARPELHEYYSAAARCLESTIDGHFESTEARIAFVLENRRRLEFDRERWKYRARP